MTFGGFILIVFALLIAMGIFSYFEKVIANWVERKRVQEEAQDKRE